MAKRNTFFEDEKIEKKIDMKQLLRTLKYILPYKKILVLVSVMMLIAAVVSLLPPRLLKVIVDKTVVEKNYRELALVGGGLVLDGHPMQNQSRAAVLTITDVGFAIHHTNYGALNISTIDYFYIAIR